MAYNNYFAQFACPVNTVLTEIQLDGVLFPLTPFAINLASPTLVTDLDAILNATTSSSHFGVEVSGTDLIIRNACQNLYTVDSVFVNSGGLGVITEETFTESLCTITTQCSFDGDMTATLDFNCDTQRFTFTDTTGDYSASNTGGYGTPNNISRSQILSADFVITDGTTILGVYCTSNYLPNADGTSSVSFDATRFGLTEFTPNTTYFIQYRLNMDDGTQEICINAEVLIPCCGGTIASNNVITFGITEKIGCKTFEFEDTSGVYSTNNLGGYGTPNYDYSDITSTLIRITLADGTVYDITDFIPTLATPSVIINGYQIGYGTASEPIAITSQVINIEYYVYVSLECRIGYYQRDVLFHCQLKSCIKSRAIEVLNQDCDSCPASIDTDKATDLLLRYQAILIVAETNVGCIAKEVENLLFDCQKGCNDCD